MRGSSVLGIVGIALTANANAFAQPTPATDELDIPGLHATDLRGDALVWEDARFFLEPWEGSTSIQFSSLSRLRRDEVGRAMPVRIVDASLRSFVEVEVANRSDCTYRRLEGDSRLSSLRFFVKRTDLAPVLAKSYAVTFGNGTSVKLAVGMPVVPTATGHYLIAAGRGGGHGDKLRLAIPHAHVGYVYHHKPVVDEVLKAPVVRLERNFAPRLDDVAFEVRQLWVAPKPARTTGESTLLRWTSRCLELVVAVPSTALRPAEVPTAYPNRNMPTSPPPRLGWRIPAGAPLSLGASGPDKREVALAAVEIPVGAPTDEQACFDAKITMSPTEERSYNSPSPRTFKLCAPASLAENQPVDASRPPDDLPAPADVAQPPTSAMRTAKGVWYRHLGPKKSGPKPKTTSTVKVHYTGWTTDGRMFDSSVRRGTPASFPLTSVIAGWTDGLQVMAVGDRVRFWIPEELAYKGRPGVPQGMLVFDVELLSIQ